MLGAAASLDEQVHRLGGAVGDDTAGGEVGQQVGAPGAQGAAQPGDFGHRAGHGTVDDLLGAGPAGGRVVGGVGGHEVLGHGPGGGDLAVRVAVGETLTQPSPGLVGEAVEGVVAVPAATEGVLLDAAAHVVERVEAQLAGVERVEHPGRGR